MKKLLLSLAVLFCAATASAQDWAAGLRFGTHLEAVGQYYGLGDVANYPFYLEGRFGLRYGFPGAACAADFSAIAAWNVFEFGSANGVDSFFADFGAGINIGGAENWCYIGPCGLARIGIRFSDAPISLSLDWTPAFGASIVYGVPTTPDVNKVMDDFINNPNMDMDDLDKALNKTGKGTFAEFNTWGLLNIGITCTYYF